MSTAPQQVLSFNIAGQVCGISAALVREVRPMPKKLTRAPGADNAVLGLFNLRGRIIAAISLRRCLGLEDAAPAAREMCLVVEYKGELYSLAVDEAGLVLSMNGEVEPAPPALDAKWRKALTGIFRMDGGLMALLDIPGLLDSLGRNEKEKPPVEGL